MLPRLREFEIHPLAEMFPMVEGQEYDELRASIREHGIINRVALYQGKVLDGRNRIRAAMAEGVGSIPTFNLPPDTDPVAFVMAQNVLRRHLTPHDRAVLTVKVMEVSGELERAREEATTNKPGVGVPYQVIHESHVRQVVAARAGVSPATAQRVLDEKKARPGRIREARRRSGASLQGNPVSAARTSEEEAHHADKEGCKVSLQGAPQHRGPCRLSPGATSIA